MTTGGRRSPSATRSGFSLLEVIVILAILGVIAGVTAPALTNAARSDDLTQSTQELITLLDRARRTAADHGARTTVTIDPGTAEYSVTIAATGDQRMVASGRLALSTGAELVAREPRVTYSFDATGPAFAGDLAIRLDGRTVPIIVDPWTGDARASAQ